MKTRHAIAAIAAILCFTQADAMVQHILPSPKQAKTLSANGFDLSGSVSITDPTDCALLHEFIASKATISNSGRPVTVSLVQSIDGAYDYTLAAYDNEAYRLNVTPSEISIQAITPIGVTRATQTLMQMAEGLEGTTLEEASITDWPAFKLRGFMHDTGRSFLSMDELKREIRLLSEFKVNTFHWHLTDKTGWRLQINAYPALTGANGITRFPGKFYTQADARELQDYAAKYGVTIIPEIDMPGHSDPFERVMGHTMQTDQGIAELKVILSEVAALFTRAPYIHIGGDEKAFPDSYINTMLDYVHTLGKKAVIWNRYGSGALVNPSTIHTDMVTNWASSGTLVSGLPNIDMRYNYTNHFDVYADLVGIYKSSIFYADKGNANIAGTISAAWSDTMTPTEADIIRQNNIYANIIASCSRAWQGGGERYIETGGVTLPNSGTEYDDFALWESKFLFHKAHCLAETASLIPYVRQTNVRWMISDQIPNSGNADATFAPEQYIGADAVPTSFTINSQTINASQATGAGIYLRHIWSPTVKGFYDNPQASMTAYAWTYVYSPTEQDAAAQIEFYTYSRSGNERAPLAGKWDRRGSRIWINGAEIPAPTWQQPDAQITQDQNTTGLTNENFTARPITPIHLRQGWNQVFLKLPHASTGGTARDKWQFTFVITDNDGLNALPGLIYSPSSSLNAEQELILSDLTTISNALTSDFRDAPGYLDASTAEINRLQAQIATATEAVRAGEDASELIAAIKAAYAQLRNSPLRMPRQGLYYYLVCPGRENRAVTSRGTAQGLYGETTRTNASAWTFIPRADSTFDIQNYSDKSFIGTTAANDNQISTVAAAPSKGWKIETSGTLGAVVIYNTEIQLNQTQNNNTFLNKIYNWGYTVSTGQPNKADPGSIYNIIPADAINATITLPCRLTILPCTGGNINITHEGTTISSGSTIDSGSVINVTATPAQGYELTALRANAIQIPEGSYTITTDTEFSAEFTSRSAIDELNADSGSDTLYNIYDLTGRHIARPSTRGIYIINGRKVIL